MRFSSLCDAAQITANAAQAQRPNRSPFEHSTDEAKRLIDELAQMEAPVFLLTGGDPIKRPDLFELIEYATSV